MFQCKKRKEKMAMRERIEYAATLLNDLISEPRFKRKQRSAVVAQIIRAHRLTKREIKEARRQLGIKTVCEDGVWFGVFPEVNDD